MRFELDCAQFSNCRKDTWQQQSPYDKVYCIKNADGAGECPQIAYFHQRDGVIGWKSCRVQEAIEFLTGVSFLKDSIIE